MSKILRFRVNIKGLDDKMYRLIEISEKSTIADFAYTILASFNSLAYHLYYFHYNEEIYDSMVCYEKDKGLLDATTKVLKDIKFTKEDIISMDYDSGNPIYFEIQYVGHKDMKKGYYDVYPYINDGEGNGMLDDVSGEQLVDIVNDIDIKGESRYNYPSGYQRDDVYDYRNYSLSLDNYQLKERIKLIKYGYEGK